MIDTAIACHTPVDTLMGMTIKRFLSIRRALTRYQEKVRQARENQDE